MAFRLRNQKDIEKKRAEQSEPQKRRGHALTEDSDGFQDLFWS